MKVLDQRKGNVSEPSVGDIIFVKKGNEEWYFLISSNSSLENRRVGTARYYLIDLSVGFMYYREFTTLAHVRNHVNKHFDSYEVIKSENASLVIK